MAQRNGAIWRWTRAASVSAAVTGVLVGACFVYFAGAFRAEAERALAEQADGVAAFAEQTAASAVDARQRLDTDALLAEAVEQIKLGGDYTDTDYYRSIPIIAGSEAARETAEGRGLGFGLVAFESRNGRHEARPGSFDAAMLTDLLAQARAGGESDLTRIDPASGTLHHMSVIRVGASCLSCHGDPAEHDTRTASGSFDGRDGLGFAMEGWQEGDVHAAFVVTAPMSVVDARVGTMLANGAVIVAPVAGVVFLALAVGLARGGGKAPAVEETRGVGGALTASDSIVERIELLSVNAAIEAARDGADERVLARLTDEIRELAERSASAAQPSTPRETAGA